MCTSNHEQGRSRPLLAMYFSFNFLYLNKIDLQIIVEKMTYDYSEALQVKASE
jgi:hypothetical protein